MMSGLYIPYSEPGVRVAQQRRELTSMARYVIGPDVAIRLAYDEAVIRGEHQILAPALCAPRSCRFCTRPYAAVS